MFYLHIKGLKGDARRVALPHGVSTIGRHPDNTIVLDQFGISSHHAEVRVVGGQVVIRDLGSINGTFVNGDRVDDARLNPGDRILVGSVLAVLQEALSDRIVLRIGATETPEPGRARRRATARPEPEAAAGGVARALFEEILDLDDPAIGDERVFSMALLRLMRHTAASAGFLLGIDERGSFFLRAASGLDELLEVDRKVIDEVVSTGVPQTLPVDNARRGLLEHVCVAVRQGEVVTGVVYLLAPAERAAAPGRGLESLEPALAAIALVAGRRDAEGTVARMRRAIAEGAEWPTGDPGSGIIDDDLLGHSGQILHVMREIDRLATISSTVLLRGEPGAGVEQAARRVHALSERHGAPFLKCVCAAPSVEHLQQELFGVERPGGASSGKLLLADGGTVFLDEVADLPVPLQSRLERVLDRGELWRSGRERPIDVDVRLVLGTRLTLAEIEQMAEEGRFSARLFEATREARLRLPPLRERPEDIVPLAQNFMRRSAAALHKRITALSSDACQALTRHRWQGNIHELGAVIHRAVVLTRDEILDLDALPADIAAPAGGEVLAGLDPAMSMPWKEAKLAFERSYFEGVLAAAGGTITRASRHAGIARKNFYHKLRQHGLLPRDN